MVPKMEPRIVAFGKLNMPLFLVVTASLCHELSVTERLGGSLSPGDAVLLERLDIRQD